MKYFLTLKKSLKFRGIGYLEDTFLMVLTFSTPSTIMFLSHLMHLLERSVLSKRELDIILFLVLQVLGSVSRESNDFCRF